MKQAYEKDLDLNLLRVLVVVADEGSVTGAAARLYLTQPAVSAALRRLTAAVGVPLLARRGRGVELTARGRRVVEASRPLLKALVDAAMAAPTFDPATSDRVFRLGMSDDTEAWLLPALLERMRERAPGMALVSQAVQFRTVQGALERGEIELAVTVADELPKSIQRLELGRVKEGFVCLWCPGSSGLKRAPTLDDYRRLRHVIVSYNGDLRGVVEDATELRRRAACSVPRFSSVGALVEQAGLLATVPALVASWMMQQRPALRASRLPFDLPAVVPLELLWTRDDEGLRWLRGQIEGCFREAVRLSEARLRLRGGSGRARRAGR